MEFKNAEKWWKSKAHRKITGSRGARFMSLKGHALFGVSVVGMIQYVLRSDDVPMYRSPPPPVEAPQPLPTSLGYSLTSETPYLARLETERKQPSHIPQVDIRFEHLRTGGAVNGSQR